MAIVLHISKCFSKRTKLTVAIKTKYKYNKNKKVKDAIMENNMTVLSLKMYEKAVSSNLTVSEAVQMLRDCTDLRSLSEKLACFAKGSELKKVLTEGLAENHPEANYEAINRKVRNWLADRQDSIRKTDAIELCFILKLTLEQSNEFVAMISQESFHWRHPDEIPYIFALANNMTYLQAVDLHKRVKAEMSTDTDKLIDENTFTDVVRNEIANIRTEQELIEYISTRKHKLCEMHNTAYNLFCEMMDVLESPVSESQDEDGYLPEIEKYSVGRIVKEYMHREYIPESFESKRKVLYSALQRNIAQNWPSETALSRMKNRRSDVTRKVLILLFLATYDVDDISVDEDDGDIIEWDTEYKKNKDEVFRQFYDNMNNMLERCGFCRLDVRSAFDWVVVYCMCVEDIWDLDGRMSEFLQCLFTDKEDGNRLQN